MSTHGELWPQLKASKEFREQFVAQFAKQAIPFQVRELLKRKKLTQKELADRAGVTQGVVSRTADPSYGNLTINTVVRVAGGFDLAFIPMLVPFSELPKWLDKLYSRPFDVPTFLEEDAQSEAARACTSAATVRATANSPSR